MFRAIWLALTLRSFVSFVVAQTAEYFDLGLAKTSIACKTYESQMGNSKGAYMLAKPLNEFSSYRAVGID